MSTKPTSAPRRSNRPLNITDFMRYWQMPAYFIKAGKSALRYKNPPEKGVYWYWFSLWVRERDVDEFGTCISCGKPITVETSQAGHFMPAKDCGLELLFDPRNVNAECNQCNAWDETHLLGYAARLDERYGKGTSQGLRWRRDEHLAGRSGMTKDWKGEQYADKIRALPSYPQPRA